MSAIDLTDLLERIEIKASGGLCQFSVGGKHEFLKDIRGIVAEAQAAIQAGGMSPVRDDFAPKDMALIVQALLHLSSNMDRDSTTRARAHAMAQVLRAERGTPAPMIWPKGRSVKIRTDMHPTDALQVGLDGDNDVMVSLWTEAAGYSSVEFCNPGGNGGGRSPNVRRALIALMVAMEADGGGSLP